MNKVEESINKLERHINILASCVVPKDRLESFSKLDLKQKIVGIGAFALLDGNKKMAEFSEIALRYYKELNRDV
jgi:hypothetical protein